MEFDFSGWIWAEVETLEKGTEKELLIAAPLIDELPPFDPFDSPGLRQNRQQKLQNILPFQGVWPR